MKIKSFEFNLRELAGSMGDFGTLIPLAIGYIVVCDLNPAGLLVMMGLANILTGVVFRLPMPIEPMKVLAITAIAQHWSASMVYAAGFAMGVIWLVFSATGIMVWIAKITPYSVVRGIQIALGVMLTIEAFKMLSTGWTLGIFSILIVITLRQNRYAPAALVLMLLGLAVMLVKGQFPQLASVAFAFPSPVGFKFEEIWPVLILAGFAQIPLTAANAVISTSSLIKTYWPDRAVSEQHLSLSMGVMNLVMPFLGGIPTCHGAGGLAGQYYFGARTGGANIIEGLIEISLGLFLASSIAGIFSFFPLAIVGGMMFLIGVELTKFVKDVHWGQDLIPMTTTLIISLLFNMAYGFLIGVFIAHLIQIRSDRKITTNNSPHY